MDEKWWVVGKVGGEYRGRWTVDGGRWCAASRRMKVSACVLASGVVSYDGSLNVRVHALELCQGHLTSDVTGWGASMCGYGQMSGGSSCKV